MSIEAIELFIKKAQEQKTGKKKPIKQAYDEFQRWKDGKLDKDTTLPRPPTRGRMASMKIAPTTDVE